MPASSRPSEIAQSVVPTRRANHSTTQNAVIATTLKTTVNSVPVLNAAPGLRTRCSTNQSPSTSMSPRASRCDGPDLGTDVDAVRRQGDEHEDGCEPAVAESVPVVGRGPPASLEVSDAPRAACMSCTVWHAGNAMARILPMGLPQDSHMP